MRTHRAKSGYLPAEYIPPTFRLVPPPPFAQVDGGCCYREKFFWFLFFWFSLVISEVWIEIIFLFFVSPIRFLLVFYFFYFFRFSFWLSNINYRFDSHTSFAWYLLVWFSLYFPRINFDLFQHCRFYTLTLQLFISPACYKQTFMLIWVCFMLVLAILRLSDVFLFVLGVVYRLGIK